MSQTTSPPASNSQQVVVINPQSALSPVSAARGESDRIRLARAALAAALGLPGVLGVDAGPRGAFIVVTSAGERLEGVSCVAAPTGGYDVSLRLVCGLVALHPLSERIRAAVTRAGAISEIAVDSVSVHFAALEAVGELR